MQTKSENIAFFIYLFKIKYNNSETEKQIIIVSNIMLSFDFIIYKSCSKIFILFSLKIVCFMLKLKW